MRYTGELNLAAMLVTGICTLFLCAHPVSSQTPYYAGKTITIVRGGGAGGSGEFQSRALMPFLKKAHRVLVWVEFWVERGSNPHGNWL